MSFQKLNNLDLYPNDSASLVGWRKSNFKYDIDLVRPPSWLFLHFRTILTLPRESSCVLAEKQTSGPVASRARSTCCGWWSEGWPYSSTSSRPTSSTPWSTSPPPSSRRCSTPTSWAIFSAVNSLNTSQPSIVYEWNLLCCRDPHYNCLKAGTRRC